MHREKRERKRMRAEQSPKLMHLMTTNDARDAGATTTVVR